MCSTLTCYPSPKEIALFFVSIFHAFSSNWEKDNFLMFAIYKQAHKHFGIFLLVLS
jgi:hypothetical protein